MQLSLEALRTVIAVVHEGGVNRAAKSLNKVPSAVSHTIQKLERDLNAKLFVKQGRSLVLTEAGTKLVEQGEALLEQALDLATSVRQIANGWDAVLRIAIADVVPITWVLSIVDKLYTVSPHTQVSISREVLAGAWDALISDRADLVIAAPYSAPARRGLATLPMGEIEFVVAVAPQHPMATAADPLDEHVYRQYRVALVPDSARTLPKMTLGWFAAQSALAVPDLEAKRQALRQGLAVGALPRYMVSDDLQAGRLVHKPFAKPYFEPLQLAWRVENTGKALQWIREEISRTPAEWLSQT